MSSDADCSVTELHGDEDLLLLACDGFFDAVKPSEVPRLVLAALRRPAEPEGGGGEGVPSSESVAQQLVAHAKAAGSSDNITVLVVFLRPPELLLAKDSAPGSSDCGAPQQ